MNLFIYIIHTYNCHDINEILLKKALNTITLTPNPYICINSFSLSD